MAINRIGYPILTETNDGPVQQFVRSGASSYPSSRYLTLRSHNPDTTDGNFSGIAFTSLDDAATPSIWSGAEIGSVFQDHSNSTTDADFVVLTRFGNTLAEKGKIRGQRSNFIFGVSKDLTDNTAVGIFEVALTSFTASGGWFNWSVEATDDVAVNLQIRTGRTSWAAVNKGGVYTTSINNQSNRPVATSGGGTLTVTPTIATGTNKITIRVNANTSLSTQTVLRINYNLFNNTAQDITLL